MQNKSECPEEQKDRSGAVRNENRETGVRKTERRICRVRIQEKLQTPEESIGRRVLHHDNKLEGKNPLITSLCH